MAKIRPPRPIRLRRTRSWVQYTRLFAMTSSVMSIWALVSASASTSVMKGFNVPKARECSRTRIGDRSEEHTSELQSRLHLVCRLLLEKKKKNQGVRRSRDV